MLPISYGDAQPLLAALTGPVAPEAWRGALPITYHIGPGPAKVHLKLEFNWDMKTIYDVIARIPGSPYPDEWIVRGNHHDAWVNGADDPLSGAVALLEEARALAELLKQGWKPKRTIIYCVWDGEEEGLLGSTEWVEEHDEELRSTPPVHQLRQQRPRLSGHGRLALAGALHQRRGARYRRSRNEDDRVEARCNWRASPARRPPSATRCASVPTCASARWAPAPTTPRFSITWRIASLNLGFGGEDGGGIYHSIYDDFYWYTHFSDGDFIYGRALAQTAGTAMMRLADADLLPYDFTNFADTVHRYVDEVQKLWKTRERRDPRAQPGDRGRRFQRHRRSAQNVWCRRRPRPSRPS